MLLRIPPRVAVSNVVGYVKGKTALQAGGADGRRPQAEFHRAAFLGEGLRRIHNGADKAGVRAYIRNQEAEDTRLDQLELQ